MDFLMMDAPKNSYLMNGHNYQDARLPIYLPGDDGVVLGPVVYADGPLHHALGDVGAGQYRAVRKQHRRGGLRRDGVAPQQRALGREAVHAGGADQDRAVAAHCRFAHPPRKGRLPQPLARRRQGEQAPVAGGQVQVAFRPEGRRAGGRSVRRPARFQR